MRGHQPERLRFYLNLLRPRPDQPGDVVEVHHRRIEKIIVPQPEVLMLRPSVFLAQGIAPHLIPAGLEIYEIIGKLLAAFVVGLVAYLVPKARAPMVLFSPGTR